jgi:tape measure domain-containing protein
VAADLSFRVGAELTEIKGALASLRQDFARVGQAAQQAGGGGALQGVERGAASAAGAVGRLVAGFASLAGAIALIGAADELNTLNARIRLVTGSTEEYNRAQVALFDLAQRTRSSLGETIGLYTRIAQATRDAGVGQEVLLGVVETINQAVQLSGASTQAAEAALVQLGQGLASGALRGEELNSILEQTPALADAIAKGLGVTRGELRQLGQDGKLSAEQVITALQQQRDVVAQQFAQLPLTVGQSVTLLKNASLQLLGAFNESTGATSGLASVIKDLADFLSSDAAIGAVIEFAATWSNAFRQITDDVQAAVGIIRDATANITGSGEDLIGIIGRAFRELPVNLRAVVRIVTVTFAGMVDSFVADAALMKDAFAAIFTDDTVDAAIARRNARVNAALQAVKDSIDGALADRQAAIDGAQAARQESDRRRQQARSTPGSTAAGTFRTRPDDAAVKAAEAQRKAELDAQERLSRDSAQRQLGILQDLYEDGRIAAASYFAAREAIELESLERSIATERQRAAAGSGAERAKALAEIELLELQKGDVQRRVARENAAAARSLEAELAQARAQQLENEGRTADAARIRLEAQYRDLLARLVEAAGNEAGVRLIRGLIDTGVARAQFDEIKAQFDQVTRDLQQRQQAIAAQRETGALSGDAAQQSSTQARADAIAQLTTLNAQLQELAARTNDPAIVQGAQQAADALQQLGREGVTGLDAAIRDLRASLDNLDASFAQSLTGAGVDALTGLFTDLVEGTKSGKEALTDFVRGFVASMAQIAARALATYAVLQLLDAIYPGLGRAVGAGAAASASVQHSGGMAGTGPRRQVPPWLFAGAPRFHSGGMVGLKAGEVPAILQTGEEVLSRADPRNQANGGGSSGTRIINVIDPGLVGDYMTSAAGERTILNVLERNAGTVRQKLA